VQVVFFSFLSITIILYLFQTIVIFRGVRRLKYSKTANLPGISILVALRNEAHNLNACLNSLLKLDYPKQKLQIVLINDRSSDDTGAIIERAQKEHANILAVQITDAIPGLSGKANAIAQGIESATGELMLITDGDCQAPATWAKAHAAYYTEDVGLVGGFTLLDQKGDKTGWFGKIQSLDWAYLLSIGTGAIGYGKPLSVLGNNFSFRKKAYDEVGGYRKIGFTIIEDFALMKTLIKHTKWNVRYPIDRDMLIYSYPTPNLLAFYHQRKRWSAGGKEVGWYGKALMAIAWLAHLLVFINLLSGEHLTVGLSAATILSLADFVLLHKTTGLVNRHDLLKYFPLWEIFYFFYTLIFSPVLLFPTKVRWKDTTYRWKFNFKLRRITEL